MKKSKSSIVATVCLTLILGLCCLLSIAGCAKNAASPPPELLFDVRDESHVPGTEEQFRLPEYPGMEFMRNGVQFYVQRNGQWDHIVVNGQKVILADLNSDGKREFVSSASSGSGYIYHFVYVYDIADDMYYCMWRPMENDFDVALENGELVAKRYPFEGVYEQEPALDTGTLVIKKRQLYYISGDQKMEGTVESPHFGMDYLQEATAEIQDFISRGMWFPIYYGDATNYYMERHNDMFQPAMLEREEQFVYMDPAQVSDPDAMQYLELINQVTHPYNNAFLFGFPERYVYIDPEKPEQLFICTELRDTKYDDIRSYYEALVAGKCRAHRDTYVMRLDEHAIYRWGKSENLYESLRIS